MVTCQDATLFSCSFLFYPLCSGCVTFLWRHRQQRFSDRKFKACLQLGKWIEQCQCAPQWFSLGRLISWWSTRPSRQQKRYSPAITGLTLFFCVSKTQQPDDEVGAVSCFLDFPWAVDVWQLCTNRIRFYQDPLKKCMPGAFQLFMWASK